MTKRFLLGMLAVTFLAAWMVSEAEAARYFYRSIDVQNVCPDPNKECASVITTFYGYLAIDPGKDLFGATCVISGTVFCNPVNETECPIFESDPIPLEQGDFELKVFFADSQTVEGLAELDFWVGQSVCDAKFFDDFGNPTTTFDKFWPDKFVAVNVFTYTDGSTQTVIDECYNPKELTDGELEANCKPYTGDLPCCGTNTLYVKIEGKGRVTSDPGAIDCKNNLGTCEEKFDSISAPFNSCPEVVLTAVPGCDESGSCYAFTGWADGGCDGAEPTCTTSAKDNPTVRATFKVSDHTLTVKVNNGGGKGKAYIWSPRSNFDDPNQYYCGDTCYKKFGDTYQFPIGQFVVIKRQGAPFSNWGGVCEGIPNSSDTCSFYMTESRTVEVNFVPPK